MIYNMIVGNLLLLLNLFYFTKQILNKRSLKKEITPILIILGVIILSVSSYPNMQLLGTLMMIIYYAVFLTIIYNDSITKKILVWVIFVVIASLSEVLVSNLMNLLFHLEASDVNTLLYTLALLCSNAITLAFLSFIGEYFKFSAKYDLPKSTWLIFSLPITTFLLLVNLNDYFETFKNNIMIAPVIIGLLISNIITIYVFFQTIESLSLKNKVKTMQIKYDTINTLYQNNFDFLHDTVRSLNRLSSYLKKEEYNELSNQINQLNTNLLEKFNTINSNSNIISLILTYRLNDIINCGIKVKTDIIFNEFTFLTINEQNDLFSTLINNAIASCELSNKSNRIILLKTNKINSVVIINCLYSFNENGKSVNELQIKQIRKIVEPKSGIVTVSYERKKCCEITITFKQENV